MINTIGANSGRRKLPLWKPARGKGGVLLHLVTIHVIAIIGLVLYPLPSIPVFVTALVLNVLGSLGTTVCNHRYLAHRTLKLNKVVEHLLILWTVFNGSGAPAHWAANHRLHHAKADTAEDVSSPRYGGFWWAHLRWLYQTTPADIKRWAPDLDKPEYSFWGYAEKPIVVLSIFIGLAFGWEAFFWVGAIRLVYSLHLQCFVNSITHMGESSESGGFAKNLWWLGPLQLSAWGENWHGNHHRFANSARLGLKWWQIDIGWYFIWTLEKVRLAHGVKRPQQIRGLVPTLEPR
jgi:fatty-acid desaturase